MTENQTAELDVCPQCCRANPPAYHFCDWCNAPLSSAAATMPAWRPWAEGFAVRRAVRQADSWFVLAGLWGIFAPQVFLFLWVSLPGTTWELCRHAIHADGLVVGLLASVFLLVLAGAVSALPIAILFVATKNFLRQRSRTAR